MDSSHLARFAACCHAAGPLELVIEREDGGVVAQGALEQPFAIIGRDPYCDIALNDAEIAPRHAFLQVIGGHVLVVDLASPGGILWPEGRQSLGWLVPGEPIQLGPFKLHLTRPVSDHPVVFGPNFHPLSGSSDMPAGLPKVDLEFRNGRTARNTWEVNRVLTLVGRAKECKINLSGDDVSQFHCYMLNTPDGLWAVDLFGRGGIQVNGATVRYARLKTGDEVKIGRFAVGVIYPPPAFPTPEEGGVSFDVPADSPIERPSFSDGSACIGSSARIPRPAFTAAGDLTAPDSDSEIVRLAPVPLSALAMTHGMAADSAAWEDLATPSALATDTPRPVAQLVPANPAANTIDAIVVPMLRQLGEMQGQMFAQFQQSLMMMMQMFGQMHREQMGSVQAEVSRIAELNMELQKLQTEMMQAAVAPPPPPMHVNLLPDPASLPPMSEASANQHHDLFERMNRINTERQTIWSRLFGQMAKPRA